jgi:hypothetical protein
VVVSRKGVIAVEVGRKGPLTGAVGPKGPLTVAVGGKGAPACKSVLGRERRLLIGCKLLSKPVGRKRPLTVVVSRKRPLTVVVGRKGALTVVVGRKGALTVHRNFAPKDALTVQYTAQFLSKLPYEKT